MGRIWIIVFVGILAAVASAHSADPPERNNSQPIVSHIPRQPIDSTAIAKVGYSKRRHFLEIEFANGAVYRYLDVSPSVYHDLMSAKSRAQFTISTLRESIAPCAFRIGSKTNHRRIEATLAFT